MTRFSYGHNDAQPPHMPPLLCRARRGSRCEGRGVWALGADGVAPGVGGPEVSEDSTATSIGTGPETATRCPGVGKGRCSFVALVQQKHELNDKVVSRLT
ncbi:hypothetical protein GCM10023205_73550 [Yinghuangia aomiensis]|uniref:Uncharacterized protein n=1 Tax=Yinghuangia aomiensis TaxID=676205 RepID=A0ABP9I897_9ACTN